LRRSVFFTSLLSPLLFLRIFFLPFDPPPYPFTLHRDFWKKFSWLLSFFRRMAQFYLSSLFSFLPLCFVLTFYFLKSPPSLYGLFFFGTVTRLIICQISYFFSLFITSKSCYKGAPHLFRNALPVASSQVASFHFSHICARPCAPFDSFYFLACGVPGPRKAGFFFFFFLPNRFPSPQFCLLFVFPFHSVQKFFFFCRAKGPRFQPSTNCGKTMMNFGLPPLLIGRRDCFPLWFFPSFSGS